MKKLLLIACLASTALSARPFSFKDVSIKVKAGYFRPSNLDVRQTYGKGSFSPQLEFGLPLAPNFDVFAKLDYYKHSFGSNVLTIPNQIRVEGISAGVKYLIPLQQYGSFYFGAAPRALSVKTINPTLSNFYRTEASVKRGIGLLLTTGFTVNFAPQLVGDFFLDYTYRKFDLPTHNVFGKTQHVNGGGFSAGLSLGYQF